VTPPTSRGATSPSCIEGSTDLVRRLDGRYCPLLDDVRSIIRPTAARICAAGHGGQILVSASAYRALTVALPDGVKLRSIGSHPLRRLPETATLYQVDADGVGGKFPRPGLDVDASARMADSQIRGWEEAWVRSRGARQQL